MKKREFLKTGSILTMGALAAPMVACNGSGTSSSAAGAAEASAFELPPLPYAFDALEPAIDKMTMEIHHDKHHAGYVRKLNAALESHSLAGKSLEEIIQMVTPDDTAVRNNGGGHYNHSLFWKVMAPGGGTMPEGKLADAIKSNFGSFETFKTQFSDAAGSRFGSGWAWLSMDADYKLFVSSTPNQDNPLMANIADKVGTPILGIDVWEHAYYLKYQNRRGDYISNFFDVVNWQEVAKNYDGLL